MASYRAYLAGAILLACIGLPELVMRGLVDGRPMGIAVGLVFLAAAAGCLWQAQSEKRDAERHEAEARRQEATGELPEDDQPR